MLQSLERGAEVAGLGQLKSNTWCLFCDRHGRDIETLTSVLRRFAVSAGGRKRKRFNKGSNAAWLPAFGGPTSIAFAFFGEGVSFVALRLRLSTGFALLQRIVFSARHA